MKKILSFIFILSTLTFCVQEVNNDFTDKIQTSKTDKHVRIKGTKVFGIIPNDFKHIYELVRYQKNEKLYIQVLEFNGSSFDEAKSNFTKESIESQGATVNVLINIKLNDYDAIYSEGPSKYPNETKLMLIFGDESSTVMILGVCKKDDIDGKKEIQEIFKSIYYDKSLQIDPLELANFEFDASITNFKYSTTLSNFIVYTENGGEDNLDADSNSFQIGTMPKMTDHEAENFIKDLISRYKINGITLLSKEHVKTKFNDYTAFELESKTEIEKKNGIIYLALILGEDSSVLFSGSSFDDFDSYLNKFRKTAETIKIK